MNTENVPSELKQIPQWVLWRYVPKPDKPKPDKPPYQVNGKLAKVNDPSTWNSFDNVMQTYSKGAYDGAGVVLTQGLGIVGIDLDNCRCPALNVVEPWAQDILKEVNSYAELSPSKKGFRIFAKGDIPIDGNKSGPVEMYKNGRFLTLTGAHLAGKPKTIEHQQAAIDKIFNQYFGDKTAKKEKPVPEEKPPQTDLDTKTVLSKMFASKHGADIRALFDGKHGYSSQSEADMALCGHLAYWTNNNAWLMDAIFRESKLIRPKWDEKHFSDGRTYGQSTIATAIEGNQSQKKESGDTKENTVVVEDVWGKPVDLLSLLHVEPEPVRWLVHERLIHGRGAVISGIGGSSKTRFAITLAVGVTLGRLPWDWQIATTGKSLLVLTEDIVSEFHRNIHNICLSMNLTLEEKRRVYENLIVYPLAGKDCILMKKDNGKNLIKTPLFIGLVEYIKKHPGIVYVAIDPALSISQGDELDQSHQRQLGKLIDDLSIETNVTGLLVSHAAKSLKEELASHNSRGGGALVDACRTELVARNMTPDEADKRKIAKPDRHPYIQVCAVKGNMLPTEGKQPLWLQRDNFGNLAAAEFPEGNTGGGQKALPRSRLNALDVLKEMAAEGGGSIKIADWQAELMNRKIIKAGTQAAEKQTMFNIRTDLFKAGKIRKISHGCWGPEPEERVGYDLDFNHD